MERGSIHVDWAISMGLFLMFTLGILVFFKPGGFPLYSNSFLTNLVSDSIEQNSTHEVDEVFVSFLAGGDTTTADTVTLLFDHNTIPFPFCDTVMSHYEVLDYDSSVSKSYHFSDTPSCDASGKVLNDISLIVSGIQKTSLNKLKILHSVDGSWSDSSLSCPDGVIPCSSISNLVVGVKETKKGWSDVRLTNVLSSLDSSYTDVKASYHFPQNKDFKVCKTDLNHCHPLTSIPEGVDVVAKTSSAVIIDAEGKPVDTVTLVIQVW